MDGSASYDHTTVERPVSIGEKIRRFARRRRRVLAIAGPLLVLLAAALWVALNSHFMSTENAAIAAARVPISSSVTGRVISVEVQENQHVKAGQPLFRLDPDDFAVALEQARSKLDSARIQVATLQENYKQSAAGARAAAETVRFAASELRRQKELVDAGVVSAMSYDEARHQYDLAVGRSQEASKAASAALAALGGDADRPIERHPLVSQAKAELLRAELNLERAAVLAPSDGIVTHVHQLQPGTYVTTGQTLFWMISGEPWVEANFKEDQIGKLELGQPAEVKVDALPGRVFKAHIESFSPGTGSSFAMLPPENATGNWVKVVQRVPVRLKLESDDALVLLQPGLSAHVKVDTSRTKSSEPQQ